MPFAIPHASVAGADGLRLSRAAFAVMIKFSDLLEDFAALVDTIAMEASLQEEGPDRDRHVIELITQQTYTHNGAAYRTKPAADDNEDASSGYAAIQRRWESACRMRQWISEKKLSVSRSHEKKVTDEVQLKKAAERKKAEEEKQKLEEEKQKQEAEEEKKKAEAAKEEAPENEKKDEGADVAAESKEPEKEEEQIDSSSKPKDKKKDKKDQESAEKAEEEEKKKK